MAKICSNCATENSDGSTFCRICGTKLEENTTNTESLPAGTLTQADPISVDEWYIYDEKENLGPYSTKELQDLISEHKVGPDDYIWNRDLPDWILVSQSSFQSPKKAQESEPPKQKIQVNTEKSPSSVRPIMMMVLTIAEIVLTVLQVLSFFLLAGTIYNYQAYPYNPWALLLIVSTGLLFVLILVTNCFDLIYLKKHNLPRGYGWLAYLQVFYNIYPIILSFALGWLDIIYF